MTSLSIGTAKATGSGALESPAGITKRPAAGFVPTARPAIRLTAIASRTEKEDLAAIRQGTDDESDGEHGRAAREVGRLAAAMRCSLAITAA